MNDKVDPLIQEMAHLPLEIQPDSDLWPGIAARLGEPLAQTPVGKRNWPLAVAASIGLVVLSSLLTWSVTRQSDDGTTQLAQVETESTSSFVQDAELMRVRAVLTASLDASLARFAPDTRHLIAANLLEIQESVAEIRKALEQHPNNTLLHQLLYSTYEQELDLLSDINRVATTLPNGVET